MERVLDREMKKMRIETGTLANDLRELLNTYAVQTTKLTFQIKGLQLQQGYPGFKMRIPTRKGQSETEQLTGCQACILI